MLTNRSHKAIGREMMGYRVKAFAFYTHSTYTLPIQTLTHIQSLES